LTLFEVRSGMTAKEIAHALFELLDKGARKYPITFSFTIA